MPIAVSLAMAMAVALAAAGGDLEPVADHYPFAFAILAPGSVRGVAGVNVIGRGDTLSLLVVGWIGPPGTASLRLTIPPELEVRGADTLTTFSDREWNRPITLRVSTHKRGVYQIRAKAIFEHTATGEVDEVELVEPIIVDDAHLACGPVHRVREEQVAGGFRRRYVRGWLIPVDGSEYVDEADSAGFDQRVRQLDVDGSGSEPVSGGPVREFAVAVSGQGEIVGTYPMEEAYTHADSVAVASGRTVIVSRHFSPTRYHGKGVSDWLRVTVPVSGR